MTIHLPDDLERFLRAEVQRGHFASEDEAVAEAVRLLRHHIDQSAAASAEPTRTPDPLLGVLRDAAEEADQVLAEAMKHREQQSWRLSSGE